jgi:NAD(P)-dependent dehydrogenase (short-subunit alcohol dehydrogenase family)
MDEVSTPEIMECMFVNAIAPFVLNSRLKPLMEAPASDPDRPDRYIINVSAMEGKFYRYKMPNHPHTNMAKAALNMLTRTSSEDLARRSRIYMNSVDTGWINDENPLEKASKIAKTNLFQTPIDEVDAAARILDPVFVGINADATPGCGKVVKDYGKFFKDYKETEW